jgi:hypothetical protein
MYKLVAGQMYRLNPGSDDGTLAQEGYLWIYAYYDHQLDSYFFKSIATGKIDWWPLSWMEAVDV